MQERMSVTQARRECDVSVKDKGYMRTYVRYIRTDSPISTYASVIPLFTASRMREASETGARRGQK